MFKADTALMGSLRKWGIALYVLVICLPAGWANADASGCKTNTAQTWFDDFQQLLAKNRSDCFESTICRNHHKTKLWAQERVDGPLMMAELARIGIEASGVKVAVIDSGFDIKNRQRMASQSFRVERSNEKVGAPDVDEDGHGTAVASLIGGAGGVGLAPAADLTVYRVTAAGPGGGSTGLDDAIKKACVEHNEIINVSWGGQWDEAGVYPDEIRFAGLIKELGERGCLVVKSAGNSARRKRDRSQEKLDDAYLRVGAVSDAGAISTFSTAGEVSAPGSGVFVLESGNLESDKKAQGSSKCDAEPGRFIDGTSFAAPITAALAANVVAVLKKVNGAYAALSNPDRIKLVNRILFASQFGGTVNGLRAVLMAERWAQRSTASASTPPEVPDVATIGALLFNPPLPECSKPVGTCPAKQCEGISACELAVKHRFVVCREPNPKEIVDLIANQLAKGRAEEASGLLRILGATAKNSKDDQKVILAAAKNIWNDYLQRWQRGNSIHSELNLRFAFDFDAANDVAVLYARVENDPNSLLAILEPYLHSSASNLRLLADPSRGGDDDFSEWYRIVKQIAAKVPPKRLLAFLSEQFNALDLSSSSLAIEDCAVMAKLLSAMIEDNDFSKLKRDLSALEGRLFAAFSGAKRGLHSSKQIDVLATMFKRHAPEVLSLVTSAVASNDFSKIGYPIAAYTMSREDAVPASVREQYSLAVIRALTTGGHSWGVDDSEIMAGAMKALGAIAKANPERKTELVAKVQTEILASQNYDAIAAVFPRSPVADLYEYFLNKELAANPILNRDLLYRLAGNTADLIQQESEYTRKRSPYARKALIERMLPYLAVEKRAVDGVLDGLLNYSIQALREAASQNPSQAFLLSANLETVALFLDDESIAKRLPSKGKWKKTLSDLLDEAEQAQGRYPASSIKRWKKRFGQ